LNLTFVKNRLLDYEVKIKGDSDNATGTKILSVSVPGSSGSNQNFSFHKKNAKNAGRYKCKPQKGFKKNSHQNKFKSGRQKKKFVTQSRTGLQIYEGHDDQLNRPGPMA
jgi:hypothetical protein